MSLAVDSYARKAADAFKALMRWLTPEHVKVRKRHPKILLSVIGFVLAGLVFGPRPVCSCVSAEKPATAKRTMRLFRSLLSDFRFEKGRFPSSEEGMDEIRSGRFHLPAKDPWGNNYQYRYPSQRPEVAYELWSWGADGVAGGVDADADIGNWQ